MKRLLRQTTYIELDAPSTPLDSYPPSPLDCALGWAKGVRIFLSAGADGYRVLAHASFAQDYDTLTMLLDSDCALFAECLGSVARTIDLNRFGFWHSNDPQVACSIVEALIDRRKELRALAIEHLNNIELEDLSVLEEPILDRHALSTYRTLQSRGIKMSRRLYPGGYETIYHLPNTSLVFLQQFLRLGFPVVYEAVSSAHPTTLESICRSDEGRDGDELQKIACFYLQKGISGNFQHPLCPSVLFFLAGTFDFKEESSVSCLKTIFTQTNALLTDRCLCYCSSKGCLPFYGLPRWAPTGLQEGFRIWCTSIEMSFDTLRVYHRELARLEIFNRLGMAHTCCQGSFSFDLGQYDPLVSEQQAAELRADDSELCEQLERIMEAYDDHLSRFPGTIQEFSTYWWRLIDRVAQGTKHHRKVWTGKHYRGLEPYPSEHDGLEMREIIELELFSDHGS